MSYVTSSTNWLVAITAMVIATLCVALHYEALSLCNRNLARISQRRRPRVVILIFVVLLVHIAEIWLFGAGYWLLLTNPDVGTLEGLASRGLPEYVYFSAMTYTTVGVGDVFAIGPIRFLAGMEALTGFVMITWSASYTFLEMQRDWRPS
jgi:Ion channel